MVPVIDHTEKTMDKQKRQELATAICDQLGGMGRLQAMINARDFMILQPGAQFRFSGCRQANVVKIKLADDDTYTVDFWKNSGIDWTNVETIERVHAAQLKETIEDFTGLALSL